MVFKIVLIIVVWCFAFVALISGLYLSKLSYRLLEEAEGYLSNSILIINNKKLLGDGFLGRSYRLIQLSSGLIFKEFYIQKGALSREDVEKFPLELERRITTPNKVLLVSGILTLVMAACVKYSGVLK